MPPIPGSSPNFSSGNPILVSSEATITSANKVISNPPPKTAPLTPIINGFLIS